MNEQSTFFSRNFLETKIYTNKKLARSAIPTEGMKRAFLKARK